ncbi:hypothetical protein OF83DRAFT_1117316, partial [Amylostereum chailletii]
GTADVRPIQLPGVTVAQFESFCMLLYDSLLPTFTMSEESWIAILALSHCFDMKVLHERAVYAIYTKPLSDYVARLLSVAERYNVEHKSRIPCLKAIVERTKYLTEEEIPQLSPAMISRIGRARELYIKKVASSPKSFPPLHVESLSIVRSVWEKKVIAECMDLHSDSSVLEAVLELGFESVFARGRQRLKGTGVFLILTASCF